jgi:hypothetical protein
MVVAGRPGAVVVVPAGMVVVVPAEVVVKVEEAGADLAVVVPVAGSVQPEADGAEN